jgi:hypothetical protein
LRPVDPGADVSKPVGRQDVGQCVASSRRTVRSLQSSACLPRQCAAARRRRQRSLSLAQLQAAADYREAFVEAVARHVQAVRDGWMDGWMDESDWRIALRSPSTDSALLSRQLTRRLRTDACAQPRRAPPSSE